MIRIQSSLCWHAEVYSLIVMFNFVFGSSSVALLIILKLISVCLKNCSTQVAIKSSAESATAVLQHCSTLHDPAMARLITEITTTTSHSSFVAVVGCGGGGGGGYIIIAPRSTCHLLLGLDCWQIFLRVGRWSYLLSAITIVLKIISSPSSWSRRCWLLSWACNEPSRRFQRRLPVGVFCWLKVCFHIQDTIKTLCKTGS